MATPLLPPSALSAMSAVAASAGRTKAAAAKSQDGGARHFLLPSLLPLLSPPPRLSLVCRLVVASMPPPLVLSTLPLPINAQPWPLEAPLPLVCWRLSSHLPLVCRLVVVLPVVACLCLTSPFVVQLMDNFPSIRYHVPRVNFGKKY